MIRRSQCQSHKVNPRYNEPRCDERYSSSGESYREMYGTKARYNQIPRYNKHNSRAQILPRYNEQF